MKHRSKCDQDEIVVKTKVYQSACSAFESRDEALAWLKEPSEALGGCTPLELLGTSEGESLVMDELMQMEHGHPV